MIEIGDYKKAIKPIASKQSKEYPKCYNAKLQAWARKAKYLTKCNKPSIQRNGQRKQRRI